MSPSVTSHKIGIHHLRDHKAPAFVTALSWRRLRVPRLAFPVLHVDALPLRIFHRKAVRIARLSAGRHRNGVLVMGAGQMIPSSVTTVQPSASWRTRARPGVNHGLHRRSSGPAWRRRPWPGMSVVGHRRASSCIPAGRCRGPIRSRTTVKPALLGMGLARRGPDPPARFPT